MLAAFIVWLALLLALALAGSGGGSGRDLGSPIGPDPVAWAQFTA